MTLITISLLGPAHITDGNEAIIDFKTSKNLALLAYLAIEAGRPHRREALAGLLWPDFGSTAARNSLRQAIATLRRVLDDRHTEQPLFITTRDTVLFNQLPTVEVDVSRFDAEWEAIHLHRHRRLETCPLCHDRFERLIELFRGEFLQGLSLDDAPEYESWLTTHREYYRGRASRALHILAQSASRRGAYETALFHARRQLQLEPLNEDAHLQVMSALAYSGRRDEAVAQFVAARKLLSELLGIEPGEELRQFHGRIRSDTLGSGPFDRHLAQTIPRPAQSLIGRQNDLNELQKMVLDPERRLITMVGPGGVGKTRLSQAVGLALQYAFPHGVAYVPLAGIDSARDLAASITDTVNLRLQSSASEEDQLLAFLANKELLLILDNYEQLLPDCDLLKSIFQNAPRIVLLVTSRQRLGLAAEWLFDVNYLSIPHQMKSDVDETYSSVQLFLQRAQRARHGFELTPENRASIFSICRMTGGLPLALELAAAQTRYYAPEYIAGRLQESIDLLSSSESKVNPRHQSLLATFEYSWKLLSPEEQNVLAGLSVFRGGFTPEAATVVTGANEQIMARLVDRSLIYQDAPGRFEFHKLLQQFADAKLCESRNVVAARRRHLGVFKELAVQGEKALRGSPDQLGWSKRLEQEQPNFRAAIEWGIQNDLEAASQLAGANWLFYYSRGHLREARQIYDRILGLNKELPDEVMGWLYNGRCSVALAQEDVKALKRCGEKALYHFQQAGLRDGIALSYHHLADVAASEGDLASASRHVERGLSFADSTWTRGLLRQHIARAHFARGELDQAAEITSELVEACQRSYDRWTLGHYRYFLAHLEAERGNTVEARRLLRIGLEEAEILNDTLITIGISWLGGLLALSVGNPEEAIGRIQNALDLDERSGANRDRVQMQVHLTAAHLDVGQVATARRLLRRTSEDALQRRHQTGITDCLMQLARLAWTTTGELEAVTWLASAAGDRKKTRHAWDRYVRSVFDELHRQMLEVLPPAQFSELWQTGQRQTPAAQLLDALAMGIIT